MLLDTPTLVPALRVGAQTDILGESPIWDERARALYWVDIRRPAIRRLDFADGDVRTWPMPELVGSIALAEDGRLVVALGAQVVLFDPATSESHPVAALPHRVPGHRFNDGRCDRSGRFWVGTMHNVTRGPEGVLYRLGPQGFEPVLDRLCIPNSLCWSPDGRTMYFADSLRYAVDAYEVDASTGLPGARRTMARTEPPGFPDGSTVDAQGYVWNAEFNTARLVRYAPDGRIDRIVPLPVPRPTCCAFGGPKLDVLFVTTASQNMTTEELRDQPLAGALLRLDVGVQGLPESRVALGSLPPSPSRETDGRAS